jgi:hypothetical protein
MAIRREPSGRWRAVLKIGRQYVDGRTFDTKKAAREWLERERAALAGGVDPRAGRSRVRDLFTIWLEVRKTTVARKTFLADAALPRLVPSRLAALPVKQVTRREIDRAYVHLLDLGYKDVSVQIFRASLSSFFAWCVTERMIMQNPVSGTRVPKSSALSRSIDPFTEEELVLQP